MLFIFSFTIFPSSILAKKGDKREIVRKEKDLEDIKKQMRETEDAIKNTEKKEKLTLKDFEKINRLVVKRASDLRDIRKKLKTVNKDISKTNKKIKSLEKEKKEIEKRLTLRLRALYKMKKASAVQVVFASTDINDLSKKHKYMTSLMDEDVKLIERRNKNIEIYEKEKKTLKSLKNKVVSVKKDIERNKKLEEKLLKSKKKLLKKVRSEKKGYTRHIKQLKEAKEDLNSLLTTLRGKGGRHKSKSGFMKMEGKLDLPVQGTVLSKYGKVRHPQFKTLTFNNGIVLKAPFGERVKSVYKGTVVYVGWLKGYGQVMIVDHGGGFYTLYGYLFKTLKQKGETVKEGMVIALVGESGIFETPALYFEVREGKVPRDPLSWLAKK